MVNTFYEALATFWSGSESEYKQDELITKWLRIGSFSVLTELTRFPKQYYPTAKDLDLREYRHICYTEGLREKKRSLLWRRNASRRSWVRAAPTCACPWRPPDSSPRSGDALAASSLVFPPLYKSLPHTPLHALLFEVSVPVVFILTVQMRLS